MSELLLAQPLASQKELLLAQVSNLQPRQTDKSSPSTYPVVSSKLSFSIYTLLLTKLCRLGPQCACQATQCLRVGSLKLRVQIDSYKKSCMCRNFFLHMHKLAILNCHVKKPDFLFFSKVRKLDMMTSLSFIWGWWYFYLIHRTNWWQPGRFVLKKCANSNWACFARERKWSIGLLPD